MDGSLRLSRADLGKLNQLFDKGSPHIVTSDRGPMVWHTAWIRQTADGSYEIAAKGVTDPTANGFVKTIMSGGRRYTGRGLSVARGNVPRGCSGARRPRSALMLDLWPRQRIGRGGGREVTVLQLIGGVGLGMRCGARSGKTRSMRWR